MPESSNRNAADRSAPAGSPVASLPARYATDEGPERGEGRTGFVFDDEFGLCLDPCEHPSVNGTTCAVCGEEVDV